MPHPLLELLGIPIPANKEYEVLQRVFKDHLVSERSMNLMTAKLALEVVQGMHFLERAALAKRVALPGQKVSAVWTYLDLSAATGKADRFALKAVCAGCHQEKYYQPPAPQWKQVPYQNGNRTLYSNQLQPVSLEDIEQFLGMVSWTHCGTTDKPPAELWAGFSDRCRELVPRE
jgi:hypothetical protein